MTYSLPVMDTVRTAWDKVDGAKGSFWAACGIIFLILFTCGLVESAHLPFGKFLGFVGSLISSVLELGILYMGIRRAIDLPISYTLIFYPFQTAILLRLLGVYLLQILIIIPIVAILTTPTIVLFAKETDIALAVLMGVFVTAGFISIIFIGIRIKFAMAFVLDKVDISPVDAIIASWKATRGNVWRILGVYAIILVAIMISMIALGLGLIWTLPLTMICYGLVYQRLSGTLIETNSLTHTV